MVDTDKINEAIDNTSDFLIHALPVIVWLTYIAIEFGGEVTLFALAACLSFGHALGATDDGS